MQFLRNKCAEKSQHTERSSPRRTLKLEALEERLLLNGSPWDNTWEVTGHNSGTINGIPFENAPNLTGSDGTDRFVFKNGGSLDGVIDGRAGYDAIVYDSDGQGGDDYASAVAANLETRTATGLGSFIGIEQIAAPAGTTNTLTGADAANMWHITANNAGDIGGTGVFDFANFQNLNGGSGNDDFVFSDGMNVSGNIDGKGGTDTLDFAAYSSGVIVNLGNRHKSIERAIGGSASDVLIAQSGANSWQITDHNEGLIDNVAGELAFESFENLRGGPADDTFVFEDGTDVSGDINGASGSNTLDYSDYTTPVTVALQTNGATGIGGTFTNIDRVIGGSADDMIIGENTHTTWNIIGTNQGNVGGALDFEDFEDLTGGLGNDTFVFVDATAVSGTIDAGAGDDTFDYAAYTTAVTFNRQTHIAAGTGGYVSVENVIGGSALDTIIGSNSTWHITANDAGDIDGAGVFDFQSFETLTGSDGDDEFVFSNGVGLSGSVNGQGGTDVLDFAAYTTSVTVNRATRKATGIAGTFSGISKVIGGSGDDTLVGENVNATWNVTTDNDGNIGSTFDFEGFENLTGGSLNDRFVFTDGVAVDTSVDGEAGDDTIDLTAFSVDSTWAITSDNAGTVSGGWGEFAFGKVENLIGGQSADEFSFADGVGVLGTIDGQAGYDTLNYTAYATAVVIDRQAKSATGTSGYESIECVIGGSASDTLIGSNSTWHITANDAGDIDGVGVFDFRRIENLTGSGANDTFVFSDGFGVSGSIDGGSGEDVLDFQAYTSALTLNRQTMTCTGIGGTYAGIENVLGGTATDMLIGENADAEWHLTGDNQGEMIGATVFEFQSFENIMGGTANDIFVFDDGAIVGGLLDGGPGTDAVDLDAYTTHNVAWIQNETAGRYSGYIQTDEARLRDIDFANIEDLSGGMMVIMWRFVDLTPAFGEIALADVMVPSEQGAVYLDVTNRGNEIAAGQMDIDVYLSLDRELDGTDRLIGQLADVDVDLGAGEVETYQVDGVLPADIAAGDYYFIAHIDVNDDIEEISDRNNIDATGTPQEVAWQFGQVGDRANVPLTVSDTNAQLVTFTLIGGGTGEIAGGTNFTTITVTNTTSRSTMTIQPRQDVLTAVNVMNVASTIGAIAAYAADFLGDLTVISGELGNLSLIGGDLLGSVRAVTGSIDTISLAGRYYNGQWHGGNLLGNVISGDQVGGVHSVGGNLGDNNSRVTALNDVGTVQAQQATYIDAGGQSHTVGGDVHAKVESLQGSIERVESRGGDVTGDVVALENVDLVQAGYQVWRRRKGKRRLVDSIPGHVTGDVTARRGDIYEVRTYGGNVTGSVCSLLGDIHYVTAEAYHDSGTDTWIGGNIQGRVAAALDLGRVTASNGSITGQLHADGDLMVALAFNGDITGTIGASGVAYRIKATRSSDGRGGTITGAIDVGRDLYALSADADITGNIDVAGNLGRQWTVKRRGRHRWLTEGLACGGDLTGEVNVIGAAWQMQVSGQLRGPLTVRGDANSIAIGGDVNANITVAGQVLDFVVEGQTDADLTAGSMGTAKLLGGLTQAADVTTLGAGGADSLVLAGNVAGDVDVGGHLDRIEIGYYSTYRRRGRRRSLFHDATFTGTLRAGSMGNAYCHASTGLQGTLSVTGNANGLHVTNGRIEAAVTIGGSLTEASLAQGTSAGGTIAVGGDLGALVRVRRRGRKRWVSFGLYSGGDVNADITVGGTGHLVDIRGDLVGASINRNPGPTSELRNVLVSGQIRSAIPQLIRAALGTFYISDATWSGEIAAGSPHPFGPVTAQIG